MKSLLISFLLFFLLLSGCETTTPTQAYKTTSKKSQPLYTSIADVEKQLIGTWNVVQTSTTEDELENETKYTFQDEGRRCKKKNLFHGYFEELAGTFSLRKKGSKTYLTIRYDNEFQEKFIVRFENKNRIHMTYLTGKYTFDYVLERVEDDIFDIM